ncbi:MAG: YibE/F family protein [Anaerolineae bacterium]
MPKIERPLAYVMTIAVLLLLVVVAVQVVWPLVPVSSSLPRAQPTADAAPVDSTYTGTVVRIEEEGVFVGDDGIEYPFQKLIVRITTGDRAGEEVPVEDGTVINRTEQSQFRVGDKVYIDTVGGPDSERFLISDSARGSSLLIMALAFSGMVVLVGWGRGLRSLLGIGLSVAVIFLFIVPQIIAGRDPLIVSLIGAVFLTVTSTYLTFGWSMKAHAAITGMLVSLAITAFLASYFLDLAHLSGLGSEESANIFVDLGSHVDLKGILLGGILIGTLGVLDDMCVGQASTVFELAASNRDLSGFALFRRGLNVGRDHISASVNTLVLAYAGASMPLFVLFALYQEPLVRRLSREPITEEVVRSLIGSLGLVLAVPITNLIASLFATMHVQQREGLLDDLAAALHRRGRWQVPELAAELGRPIAAVVAALDDLATQGYLHPLPWGDCAEDCSRCNLRVACVVGFEGKAWARATDRALLRPEAVPEAMAPRPSVDTAGGGE